MFDIQRYSIHDGPGIRTTVFLKGCPLDCPWCHNPESKRRGGEIVFWRGRCIGCGACRAACQWAGKHLQRTGHVLAADCAMESRLCAEVCPTGALEEIGEEMTSERVMDVLRRDIIFYDESGGGVTFSGGEPLMQPDFLGALLCGCRAEGIHTAVDTCGYASPAEIEAVARHTDLFLYDLKAVADGLHRRLTGVSNAQILENLERLGKMGVEIAVRVPLVPGYNDAPGDMAEMGRWLAERNLRRVHLLPYHGTGAHKHEMFGMELRVRDDLAAPTEEATEETRNLLSGFGLDVRIGGD